ncbi:MAG: hypothetical protein IVW55_17505 [Chloroflexi bacterium]|nr:hypothetical protein [Chloroflexota bacterium]
MKWIMDLLLADDTNWLGSRRFKRQRRLSLFRTFSLGLGRRSRWRWRWRLIAARHFILTCVSSAPAAAVVAAAAAATTWNAASRAVRRCKAGKNVRCALGGVHSGIAGLPCKRPVTGAAPPTGGMSSARVKVGNQFEGIGRSVSQSILLR